MRLYFFIYKILCPSPTFLYKLTRNLRVSEECSCPLLSFVFPFIFISIGAF